jgi:hypothetical protein
MSKIKLLLAMSAVFMVTAGCGNSKITQTLHPCSNLDQPSRFESVKKIEGSLLFDDNLTIVAINSASSKELISLESGGSWEIAGLNPSGKWFGYLDYPFSLDPPSLHLISYRGERQTVPVDPHPNGGYLWPVYWVNDETILMVGENAPVALLDAFNGSWLLEPVNNLPDRYRDTAGVAFSPDLSLALYVSNLEDADYKPLTLWDFDQEKEIWRADESFNLSPFLYQAGLGNTAWSPDSKMVAFTLDPTKDHPPELLYKQRLLLVDARTGELHEFRNEAEDNSSRTLSWSPDGRYIAIVTGLLTDPEHPGIIIYDLASDAAVDLCPLRKLDQWHFDQATGNLYNGDLAWSPDSGYLVFGQGKDALAEDNRISMLNIYTGEVTMLKEGRWIRFIGWSPYDWTAP